MSDLASQVFYIKAYIFLFHRLNISNAFVSQNILVEFHDDRMYCKYSNDGSVIYVFQLKKTTFYARQITQNIQKLPTYFILLQFTKITKKFEFCRSKKGAALNMTYRIYLYLIN